MSKATPLDQARPRRLRLTREGWYWLFAGCALSSTGLFKGINLITLLGCVMLAVWVLSLLAARRRLRHLNGQRFLEEPIFAGCPFVLEVTVHNRASRTEGGLVLEDGDPERRLRWAVPVLAGGATRHLHRNIICRQRGPALIGPLTVATGHPYGLTVRTRTLAAQQEVLVLPALGRLHRGRLRHYLAQVAMTLGRSRQRPRRHPAAQADVHGLRAFRSGDSPRWVHWRTTARKGELMVRQFEEAPADSLIVVLDPILIRERPETSRPEEEWRRQRAESFLEDAIGLAATVCWEWCRQTGDWLVLVVAGSDPVALAGTTNRELALAMLRCLAVVGPTHSTDWPAMKARLETVPLPAAPILVVSAGPTDLPEQLTEHLRRPVAGVDVSTGQGDDFFEGAGGHAR